MQNLIFTDFQGSKISRGVTKTKTPKPKFYSKNERVFVVNEH